MPELSHSRHGALGDGRARSREGAVIDGRGAALGLAAGVVGTAALELAAPLERAIVGGPLPFSPRALARDLLRAAHVHTRRRAGARLGTLLRWSYGPTLGAVAGAARARLPRRRLGRIAAVAGAILGLELVTLPPLAGRALFAPRTLAALGLHVTLFATVVDAILRYSERDTLA